MDAYGILLRFYVKVSGLVAKQSRLEKFWESFRSEIPDMIENFNQVTQNLNDNINAEQFASTIEIRGTQLQILNMMLQQDKRLEKEDEEKLEKFGMLLIQGLSPT